MPELDPCQVLGTDDSGKPFRMDGFQFESVEAEQGKYVINVYVAACFFDQATSTPTRFVQMIWMIWSRRSSGL